MVGIQQLIRVGVALTAVAMLLVLVAIIAGIFEKLTKPPIANAAPNRQPAQT
jgi:hypothetical protein